MVDHSPVGVSGKSRTGNKTELCGTRGAGRQSLCCRRCAVSTIFLFARATRGIHLENLWPARTSLANMLWRHVDRVAFDPLKSTKPVAWPGSAAPGAIGWVCKFAFVDRKASASDALRETCSQTLKLRDPLIDPPRPFAREARPVLARGNSIGGKFGEFRADLLKRQPDPLREHDKGDAAQHGSGITAMA